MNAQTIIDMFDLKPLPWEGGFYNETYRSNENIKKEILPKRYSSNRSFGSAIYYLLTADTKSLMHRIKSDEIFHFYLGDPVEMLQLFEDGTTKKIILGNDIANGENLQVLVNRGVWQGMQLIRGGKYALMGTTVFPGFEFEDFELGNRDDLINKYPGFTNNITKLTE